MYTYRVVECTYTYRVIECTKIHVKVSCDAIVVRDVDGKKMKSDVLDASYEGKIK